MIFILLCAITSGGNDCAGKIYYTAPNMGEKLWGAVGIDMAWSGTQSWHRDVRGSPGHHGCFNTKLWSSMTWVIWAIPPQKKETSKKMCHQCVFIFCFCVFGSRLCRNVEGKWSECSSAHSFGAHRKIHSVESSSGKSPSRRLGYVACHCALYPWQLEVRGICHGSASRMTPTLVPNWNAFIADYHQNDPSQLISPLVNVGWSYSTNCYHGGKNTTKDCWLCIGIVTCVISGFCRDGFLGFALQGLPPTPARLPGVPSRSQICWRFAKDFRCGQSTIGSMVLVYMLTKRVYIDGIHVTI